MIRMVALGALLALSGCCVPFGFDTGDSGFFCQDFDADGVLLCSDGTGDCNDFSAEITSEWEGEEQCDGIDNDCDLQVDEHVAWHPDADGDGEGSDLESSCDSVSGWVQNDDDCDDTDASRARSGTEVCDGLDNDCNEQVDEGLAWYPDADGDGYGLDSGWTCEELAGAVEEGGDCDDTNPDIHPKASERCNEVDDDCDTWTDEATVMWTDVDGDGWGTDPELVVPACTAGAALEYGDCDDADTARYPGAEETCEDTVDKNCDGSFGAEDNDLDGFTACTDCNDDAWFVYPGAAENCGNGLDDNCDGTADEGCE